MSWKYVITTLSLQRHQTIHLQAQTLMQFLAVALTTPLAHQRKRLLRILGRVAPKRLQRSITGLVLRALLPALGHRTSITGTRPAAPRRPTAGSEPLEELLFNDHYLTIL